MAITKLPKSGVGASAVTADKIADGVIVAGDFPDCAIASDRIADDAITNAKLSNSAITIRGTSTSLGGSITLSPDVNWQSKVTSDGSTVTTMVAGQGYFVDNSSAAGLVKLPASAVRGDTVIIKDYAGNFGTNNTTIQRNSHNIQGVASDATLTTDRKSVTLVYVDSTKGWLFTDEHDVADLQNATFTSATGGTVTTSGNDKIHTFTGDGNFVVASVGNSAGGADKVSYLVIAGGGSGAGAGGGGGGAGGFREGKDAPISSYTVSPLNAPAGLTITATTFPVTVGGGASGGSPHPGSSRGNAGSNSVFSTITSAGGGAGAKQGDAQPNPVADGGAGGSGGGAGQNSSPQPRAVAGAGNTPPVSPPQGNPGGQGNYATNTPGSAGGGGAGGNGGSAGGAGVAGNGGNGATTHITGSPVVYAGGGGGTACAIHGVSADGGAAGPGGGGASSTGNGAGSAGTANKGGGGGAGGSPGFCGGSSNPGGAGGSGVVIVRYKYQAG